MSREKEPTKKEQEKNKRLGETFGREGAETREGEQTNPPQPDPPPPGGGVLEGGRGSGSKPNKP